MLGLGTKARQMALVAFAGTGCVDNTTPTLESEALVMCESIPDLGNIREGVDETASAPDDICRDTYELFQSLVCGIKGAECVGQTFSGETGPNRCNQEGAEFEIRCSTSGQEVTCELNGGSAFPKGADLHFSIAGQFIRLGTAGEFLSLSSDGRGNATSGNGAVCPGLGDSLPALTKALEEATSEHVF